MKIYTRYIGIHVIQAICFILVLFLAIESFIELATQLKDVGKGDYAMKHIAVVVPLIMVSKVYQLFPMAALVGSLVGLGRLASRNELLAMHTVGVSLWNIVVAVMMAALFLTVVIVLPGESLAPYARDVAMTLKTRAVSQGKTLTTSEGTWIRHDNDFIHIARLDSGQSWHNITRYHFNDAHQLEFASFAPRGQFEAGRWQFYDVTMSQMQSDKISAQKFKRQEWPLRLDPNMMGLRDVHPDQQSLPNLYRYIAFAKQSGQGVGTYEFIFWRRLFAPLSVLVMILLAVPFIDGPLREVTMGARVVAGIFVGFLFYIFNQFLGPFSLVYQVPAVLAALLPIMVFALIGGFLILSRR
ncbi:MAG: LPS export ABC transporter permease LptG [Pseudomonadota bacterium]|nr:LPS export ABC transporter permease LptG [Pseudomonadota bacterium]